MEIEEKINEVDLPITATVVLERKQEMLHVPPDFDKNFTIDALVDSRAYVSAIARNDSDTLKQKAPNKFLKVDDPLSFQKQLAKGQLEKPLGTATLEFDVGDIIFAERFVVMKKMTRPIIGLHFMRNSSVVIDTTDSLIHFLDLKMQVKTALIETTAKTQPVITDKALAISRRTTKTTTTFFDHVSEWMKTGTVTPLEKFTETASLLISHSISTIFDNRIAVRVTNTTESPYLIKKIHRLQIFP